MRGSLPEPPPHGRAPHVVGGAGVPRGDDLVAEVEQVARHVDVLSGKADLEMVQVLLHRSHENVSRGGAALARRGYEGP